MSTLWNDLTPYVQTAFVVIGLGIVAVFAFDGIQAFREWRFWRGSKLRNQRRRERA